MALGKHVQPRYRRHESRVAEHGERFVYGACTDHEPHRSKARARNAARSHRNRVESGRQECARCRRGMTQSVWKCAYSHGYHWGHSWNRRDYRPSGED